MAKRTFTKFTVTSGGTPQPLVGTTLSAATGPKGVDPNGDPSVVNVAITDSSMFKNGDWAVLGTSAVGDEERVFVKSVPDSTHVKLQGMAKTHLNGAFIRLSVLCQSIYVQTTQGNAGNIFIGTQGLVKATYANVVAILIPVAATGVQPLEFSDPYRVVPDGGDVGEFWVDGSTGDGFLPSLTIT